MSRLLCCCLLFFASPAAAELITISEGYHERVNLDASRELLMTGGSIEFLNNMGGVATLEGGHLINGDSISRVGRGGTLIVKGTDTNVFQRIATQPYPREPHHVASLFFHVQHARNYGGHIEAIMLNGQFAVYSLFLDDEVQNYVEFIVHDEVGDPTGDNWYLLEDLNVIRNNFGAIDASREGGDTDGNGVVDLADLNTARNKFGVNLYGQFFLSPEQEISGVFIDTRTNPVPEPSTIAIGLLMLLTTALPRIACR